MHLSLVILAFARGSLSPPRKAGRSLVSLSLLTFLCPRPSLVSLVRGSPRLSLARILYSDRRFLSSLVAPRSQPFFRAFFKIVTYACVSPSFFPSASRCCSIVRSTVLVPPSSSRFPFGLNEAARDYRSHSTRPFLSLPCEAPLLLPSRARRFSSTSCLSFCVPARASASFRLPLLFPLHLSTSIHLSGLCLFSKWATYRGSRIFCLTLQILR